MSPRKNKSKTLKVDKDCRNGRTYKDFVKYINEHPDSIICEGDSVKGKKGGKVLLTLFFVQQNLQLAFHRDYNDARSVTHIFEKLYIELRPDIFGKIFDVLLLITEVSSHTTISEVRKLLFQFTFHKFFQIFPQVPISLIIKYVYRNL
jgi:ISSag9, transposase (fragment)